MVQVSEDKLFELIGRLYIEHQVLREQLAQTNATLQRTQAENQRLIAQRDQLRQVTGSAAQP